MAFTVQREQRNHDFAAAGRRARAMLEQDKKTLEAEEKRARESSKNAVGNTNGTKKSGASNPTAWQAFLDTLKPSTEAADAMFGTAHEKSERAETPSAWDKFVRYLNRTPGGEEGVVYHLDAAGRPVYKTYADGTVSTDVYRNGNEADERLKNFVEATAKSGASGYLNTAGYLLDEDESGKETMADIMLGAASVPNLRTGENIVVQPLAKEPEAVRRAKETASDWLYAKADQYSADAAAATERAKEGLGKVGQFAVDAGIAGTQMLGDAALNAVLPGAGLASMGVRSFGNATQEARQTGADMQQQFNYGVTRAAAEVLSEKLFDVGKLFGGGAADDIAEKLVGKLAKSDTGRTVVRTLLSGAGEGAEEAITDLVEPAIRAVYDSGASAQERYLTPEGRKELAAQAAYDALIGGVLGAAGGGIGVAKGVDAQKNAALREQEAAGRQAEARTAYDRAKTESLIRQKYARAISYGELTDANVQELADMVQRGVSDYTLDAAARNMQRQNGAYADGVQSITAQSAQKHAVGAAERGFTDGDVQTSNLTGAPADGIVEPTNGNVERARALLADGATPSQVFNETGLIVMADGSMQDGFDGPVVWRANNGSSGISDSTADRRAERRGDRAGASAQDGRGNRGVGGLDYSGGSAAEQRTGWADLSGTQQRTATELIIRAANASENGETAMIRTALGGDDAFAKRFYKLYQQGDAVAEQWGNFFPNVNALIAELDSALSGGERSLPPGMGAASRGFAGESFGNDTAPTQTHSTDPIYTEAERAISGLRPEDSQHVVHHDTDVDYQAQERFNSDYDGEKQDLFFHKQNWDDVDQNLALRIIASEVARARETGDYSEVVRLQRENEARGTEQGQAMRQRARFANTASGMIAQAAVDLSDAQRTRNITEQEKSGILQDVARYAEEWENIQQGETARVIDLIKELSATRKTGGFWGKGQKTSGTLSKALDTVAAQEGGFDFLWEVAGAQIRGVAGDYAALSPLEAAKAIRYQNMLSKLSTYARNLVGNNVFDPIESVSNNIGVLADILIAKRTGRRTTAVDKSWFSKTKRKGSTEAALRSYIEVALDADTQNTENRYEQRTGRTFKMSGNFLERYFSTVEKWQAYALTTTDEFQKGGVRAETQRGIDELAARGKLKQGELDGWADETARQRTFQNDGAISSAMGDMRNAANRFSVHDSKGGSLGVGDVMIPFAKVPGNVAGQFANYSPAGLARGVVETVNVLRKAKNGTVTAQEQAQAVRSIGRSANGLAILAVFGAAAAKGILNVAGSDDEDKEALEKSEGISGTQLNLSALARMFTGESTEWRDGDDLMNIGFLEPVNGLMAMAALLAESYEVDGTISAGDVIKSNGTALVQTFLDLPAMSQIQELVNGYCYSKEETEGGKAIDALGQYFGSQAASFLMANAMTGIAQGMDQGVNRNTRTSDKAGFEAVPENAWSNFKSKIPWARGTLPATLDNWGNERKTTANPFMNWLNSNILPGSLNKYETNAVNQELARLYDSVEVAYPDKSAPKTANFDGEKQSLTNAQREAYQKTYGSNAYSGIQSLMRTRQYDKMSDSERAAAIKYMMDYASSTAKKKVGADGGEAPGWTSKSDGGIPENAAYRAFLDTARSRAVPMSPSTSTGTNGAQMQGTMKLSLSDAFKMQVFAQFLGDSALEHVKEAYNRGYSLQQITDFYQAMNLKGADGASVYKVKDGSLYRWAQQNGFTRAQAQTLYKIFNPSAK